MMRLIKFTGLWLGAVLLASCGGGPKDSNSSSSASTGEVPVVRLNYRYEADVPAPTLDSAKQSDERNQAVQSDFDARRPQEALDRTVPSPDKKHIIAVYHQVNDFPNEYRLDMYTGDGKLLHKMTADNMAVHFPDTIAWAPDSSTVAFVAMLRVLPPPGSLATAPIPPPIGNAGAEPVDNANEANANTVPQVVTEPTPVAPTGILTFRSEQIYTAASDGSGVKPVTLNEGIIYFYYAWAPDSSMLVALATTVREWKFLEYQSAGRGEQMVPQGRPRVVEKNGRERRLDDNLTTVRPVWSPDSAKIACAFGNQIRLYDATGTTPTQAAVPLRNQLLISSQKYDEEQHRLSTGVVPDANQPAPQTPDQQLSTLPNEKDLASYNPIVQLAWNEDNIIYLQTAYVKRMRNEADSVISFARWHRIILTPQPPATPK